MTIEGQGQYEIDKLAARSSGKLARIYYVERGDDVIACHWSNASDAVLPNRKVYYSSRTIQPQRVGVPCEMIWIA